MWMNTRSSWSMWSLRPNWGRKTQQIEKLQPLSAPTQTGISHLAPHRTRFQAEAFDNQSLQQPKTSTAEDLSNTQDKTHFKTCLQTRKSATVTKQTYSMGKSAEHDAAVQKEFASLEQVLIQTADDASTCLKLLKKNLSEYDSRHGNHFFNTAKSYMRSDIRNAKDISSDLKHVAHQIKKSHKPSKSEVHSARNMMNATSKAMDVLKTTARNYDEKNGRAMGVKGAIKSAVGKNGNDSVDNLGGGVLGTPDTVEALVKATIRDNFNMNVLSYQITAAEKSLSSSSIVERAKVAVHEVKDKLKGDKSSPMKDNNHALTP
ncbi:unnamed protein product [Phytophthora fragariaefolia]|uniref:Unnamed protein product n=1 Tax=Phytophthora fragariaefolia TaxID=1490495 RepID=A0A9W6Y0M1_9STRA|nr:unnamed protein product [Phytophthora fragariaefolia]